MMERKIGLDTPATPTLRVGRFPTVAAAALTLFLSALVAVPARAEDRGLKPNYDWVVEMRGVVDKGWRILSPEQQRTRLLLITPDSSTAVMVSVADRSVRPVDQALVIKQPDGTVDVLAGAIMPGVVVQLKIEGSSVSFPFKGDLVTLRPRPPLLGLHTVDELVADRPPFGDGIKTYKPEDPIVAFLKSYKKPTEIEIFFGSWCPVCEHWVPRLLKSMQVAGNSKIQVKLIGVPHNFDKDQDLARQKGIRGLPTFIIRQDGVEVGRIVGAPQEGKSIEGAVADVLKAKAGSEGSQTAETRGEPAKEAAPAAKQ